MSTILEAGPLQTLAAELKRQIPLKRDIMARTTVVSLAPDPDWLTGPAPETQLLVDLDGAEAFGVSRHAHQQIGEFIDVPWKLYERLLSIWRSSPGGSPPIPAGRSRLPRNTARPGAPAARAGAPLSGPTPTNERRRPAWAMK